MIRDDETILEYYARLNREVWAQVWEGSKMSEENKASQASEPGQGKPPAEGEQADQGQNAGEGTGPQTAEPATDEPKDK